MLRPKKILPPFPSQHLSGERGSSLFVVNPRLLDFRLIGGVASCKLRHGIDNGEWRAMFTVPELQAAFYSTEEARRHKPSYLL
jgi:hypothetical protein